MLKETVLCREYLPGICNPFGSWPQLLSLIPRDMQSLQGMRTTLLLKCQRRKFGRRGMAVATRMLFRVGKRTQV